MSEFKNDIISFLLFVIDSCWAFATIFICWGLYRFIDYGNSDFWGSVLILIGFFALVFSLAWKNDNGYYN
jgi:hypothetical protein